MLRKEVSYDADNTMVNVVATIGRLACSRIISVKYKKPIQQRYLTKYNT